MEQPTSVAIEPCIEVNQAVTDAAELTVRTPLHASLPDYAEEDVELRTRVLKRSRLVLKYRREMVFLKDNSFAYFTCDGNKVLKKHFSKSQVIKVSVQKRVNLHLSIALTTSKTANYLFYFDNEEQISEWMNKLQ